MAAVQRISELEAANRATAETCEQLIARNAELSGDAEKRKRQEDAVRAQAHRQEQEAADKAAQAIVRDARLAKERAAALQVGSAVAVAAPVPDPVPRSPARGTIPMEVEDAEGYRLTPQEVRRTTRQEGEQATAPHHDGRKVPRLKSVVRRESPRAVRPE